MRMKIKSSDYLRVNFVNPMFGNIVDKDFLIKLVLENQHEQFAKYCPEWKGEIDKITQHMDKIMDCSYKYL